MKIKKIHIFFRKFDLKIFFLGCSSIVFGILLASRVTIFNELETRTQDIRLAGFSHSLSTSKDVAIVSITEETLEKFPYRSPLDRAYLSQLLLSLDALKPKAIFIDALFDQPTEPSKDLFLLDVMKNLKTPLVIAYTSSPDVVSDKQSKYLSSYVSESRRASIHLAKDPYDGTVRWILPRDKKDENLLSVPNKVMQIIDRNDLVVADNTIIDWRRANPGDEYPIPIFPADSIQFLPKEWISNKVIFIGEVLSITDRHRTPFSVMPDDKELGMMPGVEILATETAMLIDGRRVHTFSSTQEIFLLLLAVSIAIVVTKYFQSLVLNFIVSLFIISIFWLSVVYFYSEINILVPLVSPTIAYFFAFTGMALIISKQERDRRNYVQGAFSRYLSPEIVKELVNDPSALQIASEKRLLSFIFTDIEGFTTLSEKIDAQLLGNILNQYLEGICEVIDQYGGTIDKFIGDSVMCFFNSPLIQLDHADRAICCALAIDNFCESFREKWKTNGLEIGVTRIGVHSGTAVVGNFGSIRKMEYTALGDTVNAASRTEGINKYFGTRICVTEDLVAALTADLYHFRRIGKIVLKGKLTPIQMLEPVDSTFAASKQFISYESGYDLLEQNYETALKAFDELSVIFPEDHLIKFHLLRLRNGEIGHLIVMDSK